ncbi:MAG: Nramp family divalent metal transporter, partial [Candidatus Uhrbacteria bacterium]
MSSNNQPFPAPLPLKKIIGPSFIILALGLGSGEVILWPYLTANYGLGIAWGALIGISFQYFINMEIERYALIKGESVFVGIAKFWRLAPLWFIVSTFAGFGLPGIVAASAKVFASLFGISNFQWIAIAFLLLIGLILSSGKTVYGLMEKLTKTILLIGVPFIFLLAIFLSHQTDWWALAQGLVGHGEGYNFLPEGIVFATFLGAFVYSGAGGNLNLAQSIYVKEKGYGMGKYAQKISGLFKGNKK